MPNLPLELVPSTASDSLLVAFVLFLVFIALFPMAIHIAMLIYSASARLSRISQCSASSGSKMKKPPSR